MNVASCLLIILLFYIFLKKNIYESFGITFVLMCILQLFFNTFVFFNLPFKTIMAYEFVLYIIVVESLIILFKSIKKKELIYVAIWDIFVVISVFLVFLHKGNFVKGVTYPNTWEMFFKDSYLSVILLNKSVILFAMYLFIVPIVLLAFCKVWKKLNIEQTLIFFYKLLKVFLAISFIQFLICQIGYSDFFYQIRNLIFGSYNYAANTIVRNGLNSFYGFCTEPSAMAFTLFFFQIFTVLFEKNNKTKIILLVISTIMGGLTGSLSFMLYFAIVLVVLIIKYYKEILCLIKKSRLIQLCLVGVVFFGIILVFKTNIFSYYTSRLKNVMLIITGDANKVQYSSELERLMSIRFTFLDFLSHPLIGNGIGTTYCFSGFITLLSEIGIIGLIMYYLFIYKILNLKNIKKYILFVFIHILSVSIMGSLSSFIHPEMYLMVFILYAYMQKDNDYKLDGGKL